MSKQNKDLSLLERLRPWMDELRRCEHRQCEAISLNNEDVRSIPWNNYHGWKAMIDGRSYTTNPGLFEQLHMSNAELANNTLNEVNRYIMEDLTLTFSNETDRYNYFNRINNRDIVINVNAAGLKWFQDMITNSLIKPKKKNRWL